MNDDVVPDTKDWTWVLREPCPECGLDAGTVPLSAVAAGLRASADPWHAVLSRPGADRRPMAGVWSPLEYGAHVRDALRVFRERLALVLADDGARFLDWDQDAAAVAGDYAHQVPAEVASDVAAGLAALADQVDALSPAELPRRGLRSDGSAFTVTTLLQYLWHDVVHHLHDVGVPAPLPASTTGATASRSS
jgi:hypothetical protein